MATGRRHYYVTKTAIKVFYLHSLGSEEFGDDTYNFLWDADRTEEIVNNWLNEQENITVISVCTAGGKVIITYSTQELKLLSGY